MLDRLSVALPEFFSVTVCAVLEVPMLKLPKLRLLAERVTAGSLGLLIVKVSPADAPPPGAGLVTVT
jgi:hypothetical protein